MITKDDWNDALDTWIVEERERLGGPPTPEEVVAYLSGELPLAAAARVRALLVYYPELTPLLTERVEKPRELRKPFALRLYAAAATLAFVAVGATAIREHQRNITPVALSSHHEFTASHTRGPGPSFVLPGGQRRYLVTAVPTKAPTESAYELEIIRNSRVLWTAKDVRTIDDAFVIDIPGEFLTPGAYTLTIRAGERLIDHYPFRVTE
ncbi:MAG TPA: hypothetical protein VGQ76_13990 [Thermoanaerobaculia bacterium]|nr:hypothetical protein [Thermoanaerobaculia bacterium]